MCKLADYEIMRDARPSSSTSTIKQGGLRKRFVPPTRTRPLNAIKPEPEAVVKLEPIEILDDEDPIASFDEEAISDDIKPEIELIEEKPVIPKLEGKRKRSLSREVKPIIRGSRDRPIAIQDDDDGIRPHRVAPPAINPPPQIINNVVYNITYNIVNVINQPLPPPINLVQPEVPPPAYASLPGLGEAGPSTLPAGLPFEARPANPRGPPPPPSPPAAARALPPLAANEPNTDAPTLSKAQKRILDTVLEGKSVVIHGSAGTGKSVLIRAIKQAFERRFDSFLPP
jgi:hypothetical protein